MMWCSIVLPCSLTLIVCGLFIALRQALHYSIRNTWREKFSRSYFDNFLCESITKIMPHLIFKFDNNFRWAICLLPLNLFLGSLSNMCRIPVHICSNIEIFDIELKLMTKSDIIFYMFLQNTLRPSATYLGAIITRVLLHKALLISGGRIHSNSVASASWKAKRRCKTIFERDGTLELPILWVLCRSQYASRMYTSEPWVNHNCESAFKLQ